ncbi:MAG: hypothetical protein RXR41_01260 [Candidatus Marsarchaeota archaeon]
MHKNDEVGSSSLFLLKMKKGVRLPPQMKRAASPKYWKYEEKEGEVAPHGEAGGDAPDERGRKPIPKDFSLRVDFAGELRWGGK